MSSPSLSQTKIKQILRLYRKPGHPTFFSGINNVAKYHNISNEQARKVLDHSTTYIDHRETHRPRLYNPYYVRSRRELVQADLIETIKLARFNDGINYILLIIDCFTKYAWFITLENKRGLTIKRALDKWKGQIGYNDLPKNFASDSGGEFYNKHVRRWMIANKINQAKATGECKASIVERFNKTFQSLLYKYMTFKKTRRFLDGLTDVMNTYLNRPHRTLKGLTPAFADRPENENEIWRIYDEKFQKLTKKQPVFKVGDIVRIKAEKQPMTEASRSYKQQFKSEFYIIRSINNRIAVPLYRLTAAADDEKIEGTFYKEELNLVRDDTYSIERVLAKRGKGQKAEILVKWLGFSSSFNNWIPASNLVNVKK